MSVFGDLRAKLSIDISGFNRGLRTASTNSAKFSRAIAKDFEKITSSTAKATTGVGIFTKAADKGYKSVKRIAQGIIVSQAFYRFVNFMTSSAKSIANFSSEVEEARVAFTGLIQDADKAVRFNNMLQDFAAKTPYNYKEAAVNARRLLAYEFELKNMEYVMTRIADATAASGDSSSYDRISKALGQIQAKGRLTSKELIQLANTGIPAYQILREEIGLTADKLNNLGKYPIPADVAIPALLRGMDKRYGGAANVMQKTVKGLFNNIRENILTVSHNIFDPFYQSFRVTLENISERLDRARDLVREGGFGHLINNLFSPDTANKIRLVAANIQMFVQNITGLYKAFKPIREAGYELLINVFNAIMPFLNAFTRVLTVLVDILTSNTRAVKIFTTAVGGLLIAGTVTKLLVGMGTAIKSLFIVKVLAQLVVSLSNAFGYLALSLTRHPLLTIGGIIVGGILAMSVASSKLGKSLDGLSGKVSKTFGVDPSKIFAPKMETNTQIADEFNEELKRSSKSLKEMGDKAKEAGKKAKDALMSFDEVFTLKDEEKEDLDDLFDIGDFETPIIPPFDASNMFPDVGASITEWTDGIANSIKEKLSKALIGAGIGALIGGIIGAVFGGLPGATLGAKIGGAAGSIAGYFWDSLIEFFKTPPGIGTGIGALLGSIVGGLIAGPMGIGIGAALGAGIGAIVGNYYENILQAFEGSTGIGAGIGAAIGAIVGGFLGGPVGVGVGALLGAGLGAVVGKYYKDIVEAFRSDSESAANAGALIGGIIGLAIAGPIGALLGTALGGTLSLVIKSFWDEVNKWVKESVEAFSGWWDNTSEGFKDWVSDTVKGFVTWKNDSVSAFSEWVTDSLEEFSSWIKTSKEGFVDWVSDTNKGFSNWVVDTFKTFKDWVKDTKEGFSNWFTDTLGVFGSWDTISKETITTWWTDTVETFKNWGTDTLKGFVDWNRDTIESIAEWSKDTLLQFAGWNAESLLTFTDWIRDTKNGFVEWKDDTIISIGSWYRDTIDSFTTWVATSYLSFDGWWDSTKSGFTNWAREVYLDVTDWFDRLGEKLKEFFNKLTFWKKEASSSTDTYGSVVNPYAAPRQAPASSFSLPSLGGHELGGIFNKEHIAWFAEGNKAEAIIPLENDSAMQPFVNAVSRGVLEYLLPLIPQQTISQGAGENLRPIYVGNLIADDRGLKELERKLYDIRMLENQRRGDDEYPSRR